MGEKCVRSKAKKKGRARQAYDLMYGRGRSRVPVSLTRCRPDDNNEFMHLTFLDRSALQDKDVYR